MSSIIRTAGSRASALAATAVLALGSLPAAAATSVDELIELNLRAWAGETELLSEVYAPDGMHTATFYDRTNEFTGPDGVAQVAGGGVIEPIGPRIDIPATDGEWRWASFVSLAGGTACLFRAVDGLMVRHDCVLPESSFDSQPRVGLAGAATSAQIDEVVGRFTGSWGSDATVERLAEVYAPDAVHTARFLNTTKSYTGPEEILAVARFGGSPDQIGERVDFESLDGELAWAEVSDVAGGTVCIYRAIEGMITRHDCVLPING